MPIDNSFSSYLQQLELIGFFSGYPLIYVVTFFIAENLRLKNSFNKRIIHLLPFAYALAGTLYLGFQLKNLYPDYSSENIKQTIQQSYLIIWGLLSIFFWIPAFGKKPGFSLIHSLPFFFLLVRDLILQLSRSSSDKDIIKNDMKIYTGSLILHLTVFCLIVLIFLLFIRLKKHLRP